MSHTVKHFKYGTWMVIFVVIIILMIATVLQNAQAGGAFSGIFDAIPLFSDLTAKPKKVDIDPVPENPKEKETINTETNTDIASINDRNIGDKNIKTENPDTQKGINSLKRLQINKAKDFFSRAERKDPVAVFYLGLIASYEDMPSEAKTYLQKVTQSSVGNDIKNDAIEILKAYEAFEKNKGAKDEFLAALLGKAYINSSQATLGILKLQQATKLNPRYDDAWILLGTAEILAEKYEEAEKALSQVRAPERPEPAYYLGLARLNQQKYQTALDAYQMALKLGYQPAAEVYTQIGECQLALKQYDNMALSFQSAIKEEPNNPKRYQKLITVLLTVTGDSQNALLHAKEGAKKIPASPDIHNLVAWSAIEHGDVVTAKKALDKTLSLNAKHQPALFNYGKYYEKLKDYVNAKIYYEKAIALDPNSLLGKESAKKLTNLRR